MGESSNAATGRSPMARPWVEGTGSRSRRAVGVGARTPAKRWVEPRALRCESRGSRGALGRAQVPSTPLKEDPNEISCTHAPFAGVCDQLSRAVRRVVELGDRTAGNELR